MSNSQDILAKVLRSQLHKQGFVEHRLRDDMTFMRPIDGMTNAYIAADVSLGYHVYPPEYRPDVTVRLPSPGNPAVVYFTPVFHFLIDVTAIAHYFPSDIRNIFRRVDKRYFGYLALRRPFDLSDTIPTTIGVVDDETFAARAERVVAQCVVETLRDFQSEIEQKAWTLSGLVSLALERVDGFHLCREHCVTLLITLAASGREFRKALERTAALIDESLATESLVTRGGETVGLRLQGELGSHTEILRASDFVAFLDSVYIGWQKVWYLVWIAEDLEVLRIMPAPSHKRIVSTRRKWREQGTPRLGRDHDGVDRVDLSTPGRALNDWLATLSHRIERFSQWDAVCPLDFGAVNFHDLERIEQQMLDTFADFGQCGARENSPLVELYISVIGAITIHLVPGTQWIQHPDDHWLHPGLLLPSGVVIDLFEACRSVLDVRSGRELSLLIQLD